MPTLLAVLLLDAVLAWVFLSEQPVRRVPYAMNLISGFAVGQVCLAAVWLAFRRRQDWASWVLPPLVLAAASWLRLRVGFFYEFTLLDYVCRNLLQAMPPLIVLWGLVRTPMWPRVARCADSQGLTLGYSVMNLMFWMTSIALLAGLVAQATQKNGSPLAVTQWLGLIAPGELAVAVVLIRQLRLPLVARLALQMAVGAFSGYMLATVAGNSLQKLLAVEFAAQAAVLMLGIELGGVTKSRGSPAEPGAGGD